MCSHLAKVGSTYYFRMVVPQELRRFIRTASGKPRAEFMESLGTKDREEAKRRKVDHEQRAHEELDRARRTMAELRLSNVPEGPLSDELKASLAEARAATEQRVAEREKRRKAREPFAREIDALLGFSTAELSPRDAAIRDRIVAGGARMMADESPVNDPQKVGAVPLLGLFEAYALGAQIKPNTARDWRQVMSKLSQFLGHSDAARIGAQDLRAWRDALLKLPNEKGLVRSPKTVSTTYITAIRATLQWGVEQGQLAVNHASAIKVRVPKAAKLRESQFTAEEAKRILVASLTPAPEGMATQHASARRWIPWLLAYTGARVNELSQLRGEDVTQIEGVWSIRITPEAGTVKNNEARLVPLHGHLIEQGFLAFTNGKAGPLFFDPARQRVEADGNRHFKKVGERLAEWVRTDVGITDKGLLPNHAWRHLFKSSALRAGVEARVTDAIQGHAPTSAGEAYGMVDIQTKVGAIAKMPRFDVT